jgi:hypothetical protein
VVIHDPVPGLGRFLPNALIAHSARDYISQMTSRSEDQRVQLAKKQYLDIIKAHTYHHRMATLLDGLGFVEDSQDMRLSVERYGESVEFSHDSSRQLQV